MATPVYKPLQTSEIRLLKLKDPHNLKFDFVYKSLDDDHLKFNALSYCWGPEADGGNVTISDQNLSVRRNLLDALDHFVSGIETQYREVGIERKIRLHRHEKLLPLHDLIWIDALCINQKDIAEREHQIALMRQIFEKAHRVYVWLGTPKNECGSRLAVEKLNELTEMTVKHLMSNLPIRPWFWPSKTKTGLERLFSQFDVPVNIGQPDEKSTDPWSGIQDIFNSKWWTRTWVMQEGTVGDSIPKQYFIPGLLLHKQTKIIFIVGKCSTSWPQIFNLFVLMLSSSNQRPGLEFLAGTASKVSGISTFFNIRESSESTDLLEMLSALRWSDCSDPRDKVNSALAFLEPSAQVGIRPSYSLQTEDLYKVMTKYLLVGDGRSANLDVLGHIMHLGNVFRTSTLNLSSWVVNWEERQVIHPIPKTVSVLDTSHERKTISLWDNKEITARTKFKGPAFALSMGLPPSNLSFGVNTLEIDGAVLGTVADLAPFTEGVSSMNNKLFEWRSRFDALGKKYRTGEDVTTVLQRTKVLDLKRNFDGRAAGRGFCFSPDFIAQGREKLSSEDAIKQVSMRSALALSISFRSLAITDNDLIGMVPFTAQAGDQVCALFGGQVLYMLRPRGETGFVHEFIGEAYMHGMMDDEVARWLKSGFVKPQRFILT